ncbi:MAG: DNA replication and repair protein RecF [Magnetococcales bacterium]|nr:DNA replication and repair protein RecF [Magnetococcales bacterium]
MHLEWLRLKDFRNISEAHLTFSPGLNRIVGANGQGKSNLLEAVALLANGRSYRKASAAVMRRWDQPWFRVHGVARAGGMRRTLDVIGESGRQVFRLDDKPVESVSGMERILVAVVVTPESALLARGAPVERRAFLDWVIFSADRRHGVESREYQIAARARQQVLRGAGDPRELEAWEAQLARLGARIGQRRQWAMGHLARGLPDHLEQLGLDPDVCVVALVGESADTCAREGEVERVEAVLREAFMRARARDRETGQTGVGPQRDDLELRLSGHLVARYGSRGQQQRFALALKLAEAGWLEEIIGEAPLMVLDDPAAELDPEGARALMRVLFGRGRQVFVAAPVEDDGGWSGGVGDAVVEAVGFSVTEGVFTKVV